MTPLELFAAAGMPIIIILLGGAAVLVNGWYLKRADRRDRMHPGE